MDPYVIDSNFFIQAHRLTYPLDVAESFWKKVEELAAAGKIISIDKVKQEIYEHEDELKAWCIAKLPPDFFKSTNANETLKSYGEVIGWALSKSSHYLQKALDEFLDADEADAWLIAYAHAHGLPVVSHEFSEPNRRNKVKIPDACSPLSITCTQTIDMFRQLGEKF